MSERADGVETTRHEVLEDGVIVCIRFRDGDGVADACRAVLRGGLRVLEVTLTTPGALDAIATLARADDAVVGAGTVLAPDDVRAVADAGGRFALSPVFDPDVVDEAHRLGLLAIPGAATPAEILAAHRHGATAVKVFPSGALGGPAYLRAVKGPLPGVPMIPTSGPTSENLAEYFAAGAAAIGVGAELFPDGFTVDTLEAAARRVRAAMDRARGNTPNSTETGA
jgi:2-dehydro-3-deoxyphosphogluconate aldolase/(4S)-4-hydroxy-2-oxoglutarate aldolase